MATGKITKRTVDALQAGERDQYLWDSGLAGFGLKVTPAGGKTYLVQYRIGGRKGRTRRVSIGRHGSPWTADQARKEAKRLLGEVGAGRDPAEERTKARHDPTVAELCELYLSEGCVTKKPSTLAIDRSNIERHIKPLLGNKKVRTIRRADIERFQQDVAKGKTAIDTRTGPHGRAIVTGGKGTAARVVAVLGAIFTFAIRRDLRPDNPVRGVKLYKGEKRERFLSAAELATAAVEGVRYDIWRVFELDENGELSLNGDTGISAGVKDELVSIKGEPKVIPIFTQVNGPGNNATYTIVKFVGIRIMDVKLTGNMNGKRVIIQPASIGYWEQ